MLLDFRQKVNALPEPVREILLSDLPAEENYKAATSYGLSPEQRSQLAELVGLIFVNDIPLEKFTEAIQKLLNVPESVAAGLAAQITKAIFLPIGQYFPQVGTLIQAWSQKASPPTQPPQSLKLGLPTPPLTEQAGPAAISETGEVLERHVPAMMAEREEIVNQLITGSPIKFAESEMLKLPSIKNWLYDYHKYKSQFPDQDMAMVRTRYLYESPNTKTLSEPERTILGQVLKSYDERTRLPFSKTTGRLLIEKMVPGATPPAPQPSPVPQPPPPPAPVPPPAPKPPPIRQPAPPTPQPSTPPPPQPAVPPARPSPTPPPQLAKTVPPTQMPPTPRPPASPSPTPPAPTPPASSTPGRDTYREQPEAADFAGPQASQRPAPRLNGNIIDLRENNQPPV